MTGVIDDHYIQKVPLLLAFVGYFKIHISVMLGFISFISIGPCYFILLQFEKRKNDIEDTSSLEFGIEKISHEKDGRTESIKIFGINRTIFILVAIPYCVFFIPTTFLNIIVFWPPVYFARATLQRCFKLPWKVVQFKYISVFANLIGAAFYSVLYALMYVMYACQRSSSDEADSKSSDSPCMSFYVVMTLTIAISSFCSIGPAFFMILKFAEEDSGGYEDITTIELDVESQTDEIIEEIDEIDSSSRIQQISNQVVFIDGVDPEDQQSESSIGTYRTKTTVSKNAFKEEIEKINNHEKTLEQLSFEVAALKTIVINLSNSNKNKMSENKSTSF
ncbi:Oidioi.mRNA.OKI2018_I69.chr2.g5052.t1.cds [Oikopleura dioica]|uniref:Oidioi.mRNA.OKI2018_I69.chr2.g5052.t1.cds n=1 Tax=Oikopleura dioica TaxID=34765 RepID=A0ABN7SYU8_OIKDI|nr:Oidioi.mRNA.OKI2018_I69.chr2.g5052.t1.cds [Oikopleura dioica]